jgi:hypothetical protein
MSSVTSSVSWLRSPCPESHHRMYATYFTIPEGPGQKERMGCRPPNALGSVTSERAGSHTWGCFLTLLQHISLSGAAASKQNWNVYVSRIKQIENFCRSNGSVRWPVEGRDPPNDPRLVRQMQQSRLANRSAPKIWDRLPEADYYRGSL